MDRSDALLQFCASPDDAPALVGRSTALTRSFGFDSCAAGGWTGVGGKRVHRFYFNSWPPDWLAAYDSSMFLDDPVVLESQRRATPFRWAELSHYRDTSTASGRILDQAEAYGWVDGFVVPVHGPCGYQGIVSLAALRKLDITAQELALLWIAALTIDARCRATAGFGDTGGAGVAISDRARDCMRWVAAGKTDGEIAVILSISRSTVHFHIERVKQGLGVTSRAQAVALLMLHGIL